VVGLGLFLNDGLLVRVDGGVIVISDPSVNVLGVTAEVTDERSTLSMDAESLIKTHAGVTIGWGGVLSAFDGVVDFLEVAMLVGVLAPKVPDDVAVTEVEGNVKHTEA
jgi:hypothetical protein